VVTKEDEGKKSAAEFDDKVLYVIRQ